MARDAGLKRTEIAKVEAGQNQASTARMRDGLALGYGLPRDALDAFVEGRLGVEEAAAIARGGTVYVAGPSAPPVRVAASERTVERDRAVYTSLLQFVRFGQAEGLDAVLLEALQDERGLDGDPGFEHWVKRYRELEADRATVRKLKQPANVITDQEIDADAAAHAAKVEEGKRRRAAARKA